MNRIVESIKSFLLFIAIISLACEAGAGSQPDSLVNTTASTTATVEKYLAPDESFYDRSQLSGIKDYEKFANGQEVLFLAKKGKTDYSIYINSKSTAAEKFAAQTLADYLKRITGADFPVVNSNAGNTGKIIAVGPEATRQIAPHAIPGFEVLGYDGIVIKTSGQNLILAGAPGSRRGTVYAVATFLESIGCRWWTETESFVPQKPVLKIPLYDIQKCPAFEYRELYYWDKYSSAVNFAVFNKLNGNCYPIPENCGGHISYKGLYHVHTFGLIVPPEEYFSRHPQWFAEINGKRSNKVFNGQLCLSPQNKDLLELVISKVKGYLADMPPDSIVSVSQNDGSGISGNYCQCADCRAIEKEEGSPSGPIIRFVNAVAEAVEKDFPHATVDTLAYLYSQKPPAVTRPRANVQIRLCAYKCRWLAPYDSKVNAQFYSDLTAWSKITSNISIWDYTTDFYNYIHPFPNLNVTSYNIRLFARNSVKGIMHQGAFTPSGGDMAALKDWVFAKLLWDPGLDEKALVREFVTGYYGAAAPHIAQYLEFLYADDPQQQLYLRFPFTAKAYPLFVAAREKVKNDLAALRRCELAFAPLLNVLMMNWASLRQESAGRPWPFPPEPSVVVDEFIRICAENRVNRGQEVFVAPAKWAEQYRAAGRIGKEAVEFKQVAPEDKIEIQDDCFGLSNSQFSSMKRKDDSKLFTVLDEKASDGYAAMMTSTHSDWVIQVYLPAMPPKHGTSGNWKVYAAVKVIKKGVNGTGFASGVYDINEKKNVAAFDLNLSTLENENYNFYLIGTVMPGAKYIWIAPTRNPDNVKQILVDRIMLVRDK